MSYLNENDVLDSATLSLIQIASPLDTTLKLISTCEKCHKIYYDHSGEFMISLFGVAAMMTNKNPFKLVERVVFSGDTETFEKVRDYFDRFHSMEPEKLCKLDSVYLESMKKMIAGYNLSPKIFAQRIRLN